MREFRVEPEVYDDLVEAADWYDERELGLGDRFLSEMQALMMAVRDRPQTFHIESGQVRWAWRKPFPYKIYYTLVEDVVRVFAVLHSARSRRVWRKRLGTDED